MTTFSTTTLIFSVVPPDPKTSPLENVVDCMRGAWRLRLRENV